MVNPLPRRIGSNKVAGHWGLVVHRNHRFLLANQRVLLLLLCRPVDRARGMKAAGASPPHFGRHDIPTPSLCVDPSLLAPQGNSPVRGHRKDRPTGEYQYELG